MASNDRTIDALTNGDFDHEALPGGVAMSSGVTPATETWRSRETPLQQLLRNAGEFGRALLRTLLLSVLLTTLILTAFLTVDLPLRGLDRFFLTDALKPGLWLRWGLVAMSAGPLLIVMIARRYGGDEAGRVITASWGVAAVAAFAEISYLAPRLAPGDFPSAQFLAAFVISAMAGQYIAAGLYDVTRGGGQWWRAALYSALSGLTVHSFLYFPIAYWGTRAPWLHWMVGDLALKFAMALAFLPVYRLFRKRLRPRGGFGG